MNNYAEIFFNRHLMGKHKFYELCLHHIVECRNINMIKRKITAKIKNYLNLKFEVNVTVKKEKNQSRSRYEIIDIALTDKYKRTIRISYYNKLYVIDVVVLWPRKF